jgi:hypothetical protein
MHRALPGGIGRPLTRLAPILAALALIGPARGASLDNAVLNSSPLGDYWESSDTFYFGLTGGAVFLNTPKKDNSNLFLDTTGDGFDGQNGIQPGFKTDSTAGAAGGFFGYVLEKNPGCACLGSNLRLEAAGTYFATTSTGSNTLSSTNPFEYFEAATFDGQRAFQLGDSNTGDPAPTVSEKTHDYFYETSLVLKSDYALGPQNEFTFTPFLGFDYARLGQHFQTNIDGALANFLQPEVVSNAAPLSPYSSTELSESEKITTDYYGFTLGFELRANVSKNFVMFMTAGITPQIAVSHYDGIQSGNEIGTPAEASDHASEITFKTALDGGIAYNFGPVILNLSGGFQYWAYAAAVQEAEYPLNESVFTPGPITTPSHLVASSMFNPEVTASLVIPF